MRSSLVTMIRCDKRSCRRRSTVLFLPSVLPEFQSDIGQSVFLNSYCHAAEVIETRDGLVRLRATQCGDDVDKCLPVLRNVTPSVDHSD